MNFSLADKIVKFVAVLAAVIVLSAIRITIYDGGIKL